LDEVLEHGADVAGGALEVGLGEELVVTEAQGLFEFTEFFVGGRVGDSGGFDEGEVGFGDACAAGEFVEC
jgi:hypothetical protein